MRAAIVRWVTLAAGGFGTAMLLLTPAQYMPKVQKLAEASLMGLPVGRLAPWAKVHFALRHLRGLLRAQIQRRRSAGTAGRVDVLSMLLDARDEEGRPMSDEQLEDEMLTLLVAGHETTATALAWTMHLLLEHPEALARVREEVAGFDVDRVAQLEQTDAAIKEALRLRPVIPLVGRVVKQPTTIDGIALPAGVSAIAGVYLTHRRPDLWPDPLRYDPTRFIGRKVDPYHFYPFGGGNRRCLGMAFASYEMKIVLATILERTALRAAPGEKVRVVRRGITFAPSGGMPVVIPAAAQA
jgi:cytochrome P450